MFLSGKKAIVWIQENSFSVFLLAKIPTTVSFDFCLAFQTQPQDLKSLSVFLKENHIRKISLLINEPFCGQQSFVYDASAEKINRKEIVDIAKASFSFDIDNPYLCYDFHKKEDKTVIRVTALDQKKLAIVQENLSSLNLKVLGLDLASSSLAKIFSRFHPTPFIVLYGLNKKKTLVIIGHQSLVYTSELKNISSLKIQSMVNKVKMFFDTGPLNKVFFQSGYLPDLAKDSKLHIVDFTNQSIAQQLKFSKDLPLPVLGTLLKTQKPLIKIKPRTMTIDKKNPHEDIIKVVDTQEETQEPLSAPLSQEDGINDSGQTEEAFKILSASQKETFPRGKILTIVIISAIFTIILLTFLVFRPFSKINSEKTDPLAQITPTEAPTPTLLPTPAILYEAKIKIQNATSISGLAGKLKTQLIDLDFQDLTSTNAPQKTDENIISCKENYQNTAIFIQKSLVAIYPATVSADLKKDDDYDLILTIGQDLQDQPASDDQTENGTEEE